MVINKILVFKDKVEIYANLAPLPLSGGLNLEITAQDFMIKANGNSGFEEENRANNIEIDKYDAENTEKDGDKPPFSVNGVDLPMDISNRKKSIGGTSGAICVLRGCPNRHRFDIAV